MLSKQTWPSSKLLKSFTVFGQGASSKGSTAMGQMLLEAFISPHSSGGWHRPEVIAFV